MTLHLRKFVLTIHIICSIGWLGAVAGFLALSITGLTSQDAQMVRSSYLTMEAIGWYVIVPFSIGALLSGLTLSLGTQWGLFRYYWVLVKFFLTLGATILLLLHMQPISYMAGIVSEVIISSSMFRSLRIQLIADAGGGLLVLLVATILSVYKPWGRIKYGLPKPNNGSFVLESKAKKPWRLYLILGVTSLLIVLFIVLHLTGTISKH